MDGPCGNLKSILWAFKPVAGFDRHLAGATHKCWLKRRLCGLSASHFSQPNDSLKRLEDMTMQHHPWLYATQRPRR
jgi:hypothetical protein